ncbi:MAG: AAA family ATPase [Thiogranum sp.]
MLRIAIMNTKGGCGKTTVATNLASYCAAQGCPTALFDYDRQASSTRWLNVRQDGLPFIHGVAAFEPPRKGVTRAWQMALPAGTQYVIADTPAGYSPIDIEDRVSEADVILIPILPSSIDIHCTADFIQDLLLISKARSHNKRLGIIANRTRLHSRAADKLDYFLQDLDIPVIGRIRDTQHYVSAVEQGAGIHELAEQDARKHADTWGNLLTWLDSPQRPIESMSEALRKCSGTPA